MRTTKAVQEQHKKDIRKIIRSREFSTQAELHSELIAQGVHISQPTLSRYLADLGANKRKSLSGKSVYYLPTQEHPYKLRFSGTLAVLHTQPGYAGAAASRIDEVQLPEVIGTLAGDDTVLLILSEKADRKELQQKIYTLFAE